MHTLTSARHLPTFVSMDDGLNEKQRRFADEYVVHGSGSKAAIAAGYEPKWAASTGTRLQTNPLIRARIKAANGKRQAVVQITQQDVLRKLMDTYDNAGKAGQYTAQARAAELLGRHLAMFTDKVLIDDRRIMTDADLIAALASGDGGRAQMLRDIMGVSDKPPPKLLNNIE